MAIPWTKLPQIFAPDGLQADLAAIVAAVWVPHFNTKDYDGQWSSVALRSRTGHVKDIMPVGTLEEYRDTPLMECSPHLRAAVEAFAFPKMSVRLLRLHAGARVLEHTDRCLGLEDGEVRLHVPITTNEQVEFVVAGRQLRLRAGESWYIDFTQPHRIFNGGSTDRVHLVIDGPANEWVLDLVRRSAAEIVTETTAAAN